MSTTSWTRIRRRTSCRSTAPTPTSNSTCTRIRTNANYYISMNLGVPPFDDIHVRKALNYVFDKAGSIQLSGGPLTGSVAGHMFPDGLLDNQLKDYDPYATEDGHGDLEKAKAEMAQSKYDADDDGVCDDPVCENVITLGVQQDPGPRRMALFTQNLQGSGDRGHAQGPRRPRDLFQVHLVSRPVPACACTSDGCRTTQTCTPRVRRCSMRAACTRRAATTRSWERARISWPSGDTRPGRRSRMWATS